MMLGRTMDGSKSKDFSSSAGVVHFKQKSSRFCFNQKSVCRIEVFSGTSGSSRPRAHANLNCSYLTISSRLLEAFSKVSWPPIEAMHFIIRSFE
jgi:hypothetical protein